MLYSSMAGESALCKQESFHIIYCLSGARSGKAIAALGEKGYTRLTNIGGIRAWRGEIEK